MLSNLRRAISTKGIKNLEEIQYLELVNDIIKKGDKIKSRNGITRNLFGTSMKFSLENNRIPILTSKKVD